MKLERTRFDEMSWCLGTGLNSGAAVLRVWVEGHIGFSRYG